MQIGVRIKGITRCTILTIGIYEYIRGYYIITFGTYRTLTVGTTVRFGAAPATFLFLFLFLNNNNIITCTYNNNNNNNRYRTKRWIGGLTVDMVVVVAVEVEADDRGDLLAPEPSLISNCY